MGVPGRIVGDVRPDLAAFKRVGTRWYQHLAVRTRESFVEVPLEGCHAGEPGAPGSRGSKRNSTPSPRSLAGAGRALAGLQGVSTGRIDKDEPDRPRHQAGRNDEGERET